MTLDVYGMHLPYLDFFFNRKLSFKKYIFYYTNKTITSVRAMASFENSVWRLNPKNKWLLYYFYILPVTTYDVRLWNYKDNRNKIPFCNLKIIQASAAC